ncbi:NAD(P)-binding oxidoreductase [Arthrobacter monumenti]
MSNIIVFGGHGRVAQRIIPLLVEDGNTVTAVIRREEQADDIQQLGATARIADVSILTIDQLAELVTGHDAIVWAAGAGGGSMEATYSTDRDAAIYSMQAAIDAGVLRYVMVSWAGASLQHGVPQSESFFAYAQSKMIADAVLRDSGLDWTIVAPTTLSDEEATGVGVDTDGSRSTSRASVAAMVTESLKNPASIQHTYRFSDGEAPAKEFITTAG